MFIHHHLEMSGKRPEHIAPPEIFYNYDEANKYTQNSRIISIQESMSNRAIELLELNERDGPQLILDLGCGSGLSSQCIEEAGHKWIGVDISEAMITVAKERRSEGELEDLQIIESDLGDGLPFKPGSFDAAISISALQWLCNADKKSHSPAKRLLAFFSTLYTCLTREGRAVLQFYPENPHQVELINNMANKAGFCGGLVVDNPESTKAKKFFLVLSCNSSKFRLPKALDGVGEEGSNQIKNEKRQRISQSRSKGNVKDKDWILQKKERRRRQGKITRPDTKYTGRRRTGRL